jgi:hypothetical protein
MSRSPAGQIDSRTEHRFARVLRAADSFWGSLLLCLVFSTVMMFNCVFPLNAVWAADGIVEPDCAQMIWNLWHVNEAVTSGHNPYASTLIYYPAGAPNLSHHSLAAGFFPVTFLVKKMSGASPLYPLYAYRILILLCFMLLLHSSYRLLRELDCSAWAAAIAAVAYSFADFFMEHIAHLNMLAGFFIPLTALSLVRLYRQPERVLNIIKTALLLSCAIYFTEFTLYIHLGLLLVLLLLLLTKERQALMMKLRLAGRPRLLAGLAIYTLIITPFVALLLADDFIKPPASEIAFYSANLAGFFAPNPVRTPLYGQLFAGLGARIKSGIGGYEVFTSFVLMGGAALALWKSKRRAVRVAAIAALFFYVLSLGPTLKVLGAETNIPLPYNLLMRLPPFDANRTPSRFVVMGLFFLMIVAACGLTWLHRALIERRGKRWSSVFMLLIFVWATLEAYSPTPRQQSIEAPPNMEEIVAGPILNLPLLEADGYALFLQLFHRQPISTGYLARSSERRRAQFEAFRRVFAEGGARLCDEAERMGFRNVVIAPAVYWSRYAPLRVPLDLSQCRLNVVDMNRQEGSANEPDESARVVLPPQPLSFPLARGKTLIELSQAQADAFLWYGWSGREMFSRWTEQRRAAVVFALEELSPATLRVKLASYLAPGKLPAQRVKMSLNGEALTTLMLNDPSPQVYSIELPRSLLRERNVLVFELPDAQSPKQLGVGEDLRLLGINVQWLELTMESAGQ